MGFNRPVTAKVGIIHSIGGLVRSTGGQMAVYLPHSILLFTKNACLFP